MTYRRVSILVSLTCLLACVEEEPVSGQQAYLQACAACHGTDAMGGADLTLDPPPPDLTGLSLANNGIYPRDRIMSIIDGLNRAPHFSAAMPEFGAGDLGEVIVAERDGSATAVPETLLALADYLESIQR